MKIKGQTLATPNIETIIIPRGDNEPIIFLAQGVLDTEDFDKIVPVPTAPRIVEKGGAIKLDLKDKSYIAEQSMYGEKKMAWLVLKSLEATPDLEWDTVDMGDSSTWANYRKELKDAKFSDYEIIRIINGVLSANCLNDARLDEAKARFLAGKGAALASS